MTDPLATRPADADSEAASDPRLAHTAHHEAAHAVVAVRLGIRLEYVSIAPEPAEHAGQDGARGTVAELPTDEARGLVERLNRPGPFQAEAGDPMSVGDRVRFALAGPAADRRHLGRSDIGGRGDLATAQWLRDRVGFSEDEFARLEEYAEAMVERDWPAIEAVAQELLRVVRLSGEDVRGLVHPFALSARPK